MHPIATDINELRALDSQSTARLPGYQSTRGQTKSQTTDLRTCQLVDSQFVDNQFADQPNGGHANLRTYQLMDKSTLRRANSSSAV